MNASEKPIKNYCNRCQGNTNHRVIVEKIITNDTDDYLMSWHYSMLECLGCEQVCFRKETHDYEVSYPDEFNEWVHEIKVDVFPYPLKNHKAISDIYILPSQIGLVYGETLNALKCKCYLLAGVGFRAIIEAICIEKEIAGRTLEVKINNLVKNRFITEKEAERLHAVRFMGNDSVHDMAVPKENALYIVLEIIEHILKNLYIIDHQAKPLLDTYITDPKDFIDLLNKKIKKFRKDDNFPLAKYLGKDVRRLNGRIEEFQEVLIKLINEGTFTPLTLGEIKEFGDDHSRKFQHFIKNT